MGERDNQIIRRGGVTEIGYKFNKIAINRRARMIYTKLLIDVTPASGIEGAGKGERLPFFNLCNLL